MGINAIKGVNLRRRSFLPRKLREGEFVERLVGTLQTEGRRGQAFQGAGPGQHQAPGGWLAAAFVTSSLSVAKSGSAGPLLVPNIPAESSGWLCLARILHPRAASYGQAGESWRQTSPLGTNCEPGDGRGMQGSLGHLESERAQPAGEPQALAPVLLLSNMSPVV